MLISLIAAMTHDRVIGKNNQLPWHLPADLKHFKSLTLEKSIIMGRRTYESIGKALPERRNIVVTHQKNYIAPGCIVAHSLKEACEVTNTESEVFVIGGAALYEEALPHAHHFYLTLIHALIPGNIRFPSWNPHEWEEVSRDDFPADQKNEYPFSFILLKRKTVL